MECMKEVKYMEGYLELKEVLKVFYLFYIFKVVVM